VTTGALTAALTRLVPLTLAGAMATARTHCDPACFTYHASWRLFRRTGLKGSPAWHTGFYQRALAEADLPARVRVLVCAASDEAMINFMARQLGAQRLEVHLVDACRTPLVLAQAYAKRHRIALTCTRSTAPELEGLQGPFDLIVTDGLMALLPRTADRDALADRLSTLLTPSGTVLYTARIAGPAGVLEFDRIGRIIQGAAARWAWPGPPEQRRALAKATLTRPSRPAPFTSSHAVAQVFTGPFGAVRVLQRTSPGSTAVALHPASRHRRASTSVGVAATRPRRSA